jgi:hypothetical protein
MRDGNSNGNLVILTAINSSKIMDVIKGRFIRSRDIQVQMIKTYRKIFEIYRIRFFGTLFRQTSERKSVFID